MFGKRKARLERLRGVIGLSASGMTYQQIGSFIGVGSRQRVQQLVVEAVERLPEVARDLGVTGRRHPGRRPNEDSDAELQREVLAKKPTSPRPSTRAQHLATAEKLLSEHGGCYPRSTEMLRTGHGALYQFMRKYPSDFELLLNKRRAGSKSVRRKRPRRRRF